MGFSKVIWGQTMGGNIIAYQIRQSFKPGEITPEEANQVGYETAMRFTKGNHAFIVATHTDKAHMRIIVNADTARNSWKSIDRKYCFIRLPRMLLMSFI